ncbi:membrane protein [Gordonia phage Eyre]|uniref:Membrane protein n=1 Tax=Gordonia phage Eyre TaxID=1887646 RepID=A0A1B3AZX6_9CAUD|nr:membrane protein [Gordonia phage Eyre]AOE44302.1 membrane protein [Gordonia phage Eyre]
MKRAAKSAAVTLATGALLLPALDLVGVEARIGANVLIVTIAVLSGVFTIVYGTRSQWWRTHAGRAVLYLSTALTLFAGQVGISAWTGSSYLWRNEIRFVLYFLLAATLANLIWTLLIEQAKDER